MKNPISKISFFCAALAAFGFRPGLPDCRADSTLHVLEYPRGYGCFCCPNVTEFGYYRTTWRQWPCEARPDKSFPRSIGMEVLPAPQGEKEIPLPRAPVTPPGQSPPGMPPSGQPYPGLPSPGETLPGGPPSGQSYPGLPSPGSEGALPPKPEAGLPLPGPGVLPPSGESPPAGLPSEQKLPVEPKIPSTKESPKEPLPGQPSGKPNKEFNATPGLPPELDTPPPMDPEIPQTPGQNEDKSKSQNKKTAGNPWNINPNANAYRRNASVELRLVEKNGPNAPFLRPIGREQSVESPGASPRRGAAPLQRLPNVSTPNPSRGAQSSGGPRADWNASLQPGAYGERARPSWYSSNDDLARAAQYEEPAGASAFNTRNSQIVPQSYQKRVDPGRTTPAAAAQRRTHLAIEGYCPVELAKSGRWVEGDPQSSVVYRGKVYRFSGLKQRQQFLAAPEKFVPAFEGRDPVVLVKEKHVQPGRVDYCAMYQGRIYLFSSVATQKEFQRNPQRYGMRTE
jgi:YHS domain-containing protein